MKLQKFFFALIILFISVQTHFAQEKPEAVLIDELDVIYCDDFLARIDNFFVSLQNEPNSFGYAVISGNSDEILKKTTYEMWLKGAIRFRNFNADTIKIIRSENTENIRIQFWKVPAGAEKPSFDESEWNFSLPPKTKPFIFYSNNGDFDQICSTVGYEKIYSEFILANPKSRGHIVIYENTVKNFNKVKEEFLKSIPDLPGNRLKFFHSRQKDSLFELWIVP